MGVYNIRSARKKAYSKAGIVWVEGRARPCLLQKNVKGTVKIVRQTAQPTVPFTKKRQRHGQNREADGTTDRAFCKKTSKARSKPERRGRPRPCLLQKNVKGTVKIGAKRSSPTVPFAKKRQRHGQNRSEAAVPDRAFYKKVAKARSKPERRVRPRPCLLQKKWQRHGQNRSLRLAPDRAFCKKVAKARSKS